MSPRARHLDEMRLALAEGLSLPAARHRMAELRLRASREARAKAREGAGIGPAPDAPHTPRFWWETL